MQRPPIPPFTRESALAKVQAAEDAWNTRDPKTVAQAYTENSELRRVLSRPHHDRAIPGPQVVDGIALSLDERALAFTGNRISVRFEYEWQHAKTGQWYRTHGNEHWEFDASGYMSRCDMSANDVSIAANDRRIER
jgi:nuclear transport factor 2 (NTF2) superfamily protein